ncbi:hypothetical protein P7K49_019641 [Saguinus oedipus]|uniref:Uncharacterized protein n=1 Tax=Saguinus oedipus TaxID=9490 RepID=A0ABQ9UXZ0_SAGOE|nr:hypothetical protein P7K49_019641 [Saguinus oedipus]
MVLEMLGVGKKAATWRGLRRQVHRPEDRPVAKTVEWWSLMFWTNWNEQHPSIMRAALSGANVLTLIEKDIRTPNGLAIDHRAEKLYFSDATLDKIERCEYDGSHRYVSLRGGGKQVAKGRPGSGLAVSQGGGYQAQTRWEQLGGGESLQALALGNPTLSSLLLVS